MAKSTKKAEVKKEITLHLENEPLFASATSRLDTRKITGDFFYYDGIRVNGRTRICQNASERGKIPASSYTIGWVCK